MYLHSIKTNKSNFGKLYNKKTIVIKLNFSTAFTMVFSVLFNYSFYYSLCIFHISKAEVHFLELTVSFLAERSFDRLG